MRRCHAERRRRFDQDFRDGAVGLCETRGDRLLRSLRDLGINEGTLGNWVNRDKSVGGESDELSESERQGLQRLRKEVVELSMQRDVLRRNGLCGGARRGRGVARVCVGVSQL